MNIDHIATRFIERLDPTPGDVPIDHPYRRRWWLPIVGPTATVLLDHLATHDDATSDWHVTPVGELATTLGLGKGTGRHSPLIRTIERLTHFGFGHLDVEPGDACDPCISLYRTIGLVPQRFVTRWPDTLQAAHAVDLAHLYRQAG